MVLELYILMTSSYALLFMKFTSSLFGSEIFRSMPVPVKGVQKNVLFLWLFKTFFLLTKSFECQRKSFRHWTKENFDTCPRSEGLIITELCHFLWDQFMLTQHESKFKNCQKMGCSKSWFPRKRSYLSEYESYRPETGVKIFLGSIPKTFSLTPKRLSE